MDVRLRYKCPSQAGQDAYPETYVFTDVREVQPVPLRSKPGYSLIGQSNTSSNDRLDATVIDVHPDDRRFLSSPLDRFPDGRTIAEYQIVEVGDRTTD